MIHRAIVLLLLALSCGCTHYTYINEVELSETREIGSAEIDALPKQITVAELFRRWGPAAAGRELIYLYRTKIKTINLMVVAISKPPDDYFTTHPHEDWVGAHRVTQILFMPAEGSGAWFPIAWEQDGLSEEEKIFKPFFETKSDD